MITGWPDYLNERGVTSDQVFDTIVVIYQPGIVHQVLKEASDVGQV